MLKRIELVEGGKKRMQINERVYRKKSPEAIALEHTIAHYLLFYHPDREYVLIHDTVQQAINIELSIVAAMKEQEEKTREALKGYVV